MIILGRVWEGHWQAYVGNFHINDSGIKLDPSHPISCHPAVPHKPQAFSGNGWLRTGDLGLRDSEGRLWLLGRAKDMIKSGGENVFAPEVEQALCQHPAVAAAAVVGVPDERLGEKVSNQTKG